MYSANIFLCTLVNSCLEWVLLSIEAIFCNMVVSVLYQVLNKQVPVLVPVHKAEVQVPILVVQVQVPVPNLQVQVPVPVVLCSNFRLKVMQHEVKVIVCCRINNQLCYTSTSTEGPSTSTWHASTSTSKYSSSTSTKYNKTGVVLLVACFFALGYSWLELQAR